MISTNNLNFTPFLKPSNLTKIYPIIYLIYQWFNHCADEIQICCDKALSILCKNYGYKVIDWYHLHIWFIIHFFNQYYKYNHICFVFCSGMIDLRCNYTRNWRDASCSLSNNGNRMCHFIVSSSWKFVCYYWNYYFSSTFMIELDFNYKI